jgi:hypothetical protein
MAEMSLQEIHNDLESIKRDVAQLKEALIGTDGELSDWAKNRIEEYKKNGPQKLTSQKEIEEKFS